MDSGYPLKNSVNIDNYWTEIQTQILPSVKQNADRFPFAVQCLAIYIHTYTHIFMCKYIVTYIYARTLPLILSCEEDLTSVSIFCIYLI